MSNAPKSIRCAIYTRKSSEEGLEQSFNSLHAQREACEAYVLSQKHEGWLVLSEEYDDGGFSGGNMERPGLKKLLADIASGKIDVVVVYKVDRLTRSLADFARIVESFDSKGISFVSVTQQFNTTSSMGRLTLNVLLSFAQFEREVTGERIRDKVAASKKKGMWMGGKIPLGYQLVDRKLVIHPNDAKLVHRIFDRYLKLGNVRSLQEELAASGVRSRRAVFSRGSIYHLLNNPIYIGKIRHKGTLYSGIHEPILGVDIWERTQESLKNNGIVRRRSHNVPSARLLHGKLVSASGAAYTPTHASKGGRRYFYYTLNGGTATNGDIKRLPASMVEDHVVGTVSSLLADPIRLAQEFPGLEVRSLKLLISAASHRAEVLAAGHGSEGREFINDAVRKVTVDSDVLRVELDRGWLAQKLANIDPAVCAPVPIIIEVPFRLARRGSEVRLILTGLERSPQQPIPALTRAVRQAQTWRQWIIQGEVRTMRELAKRAGMDRHYTSRILKLANLSPDLTEAILTGNHSPTLTLVQLTDSLSLEWEHQTLPA